MTTTTADRKAKVTLPTSTSILITRTFEAPRHLVYRAWTVPELVARWWHAKRGEITSIDIDLRVGGKWRWVMQAFNGMEVGFRGEYLEIVPDERLVSTEIFEPFPDNGAVNTLDFVDLGGGRCEARLHVQHQNQQDRDMHVQSGMEDGLQDALDLLEEVASSQ